MRDGAGAFLEMLDADRSQTAKLIHVVVMRRGLDRLLQVLPQARSIHLLRDPRDVARSSIAMGGGLKVTCRCAGALGQAFACESRTVLSWVDGNVWHQDVQGHHPERQIDRPQRITDKGPPKMLPDIMT